MNVENEAVSFGARLVLCAAGTHGFILDPEPSEMCPVCGGIMRGGKCSHCGFEC